LGLLFILALLTPLTNLKFADLQPVDGVLLLVSAVLVIQWIVGRNRLLLEPTLARLATGYAVFLLAAALLALLSLRLQFYPPSGAAQDPLRSAPFLSIAKLVQLTICVTGFLCLGHILGKDWRLLKAAAALYVWIGVLSSLYAIVSWIILYYFNLDLLGSYVDYSGLRTRAFFNEGGPYGLYAVSIILVGLFRRYTLRTITSASLLLGVVLPVGASLILSSSKSGAICLVLLFAGMGISGLRISHLV